jgi:cytoskeletal protein CcmA (bactofilin family)
MPTSATNPQHSSESVLGQSSQVRGRVVGDGDLRVLGTIDGEVSLHGTLTIGPGGAVRGEQCEARDVSVEGELVADVTAEGSITVHPGATVRGRLRAGSVRLHEGANVSADLDAAFDLPPELR